MKSESVYCFWVLFLLGFEECCEGRLLASSKPERNNAAACARCTLSIELEGAAIGQSKSTGVPYSYLTTLDPTARNALKDHRSSLTISEYPIGTCGKADPENHVCAKITLTGKVHCHKYHIQMFGTGRCKLERIGIRSSFPVRKHPEMKGWPKNHDFQIFKLETENIFMINWFGGPKPLTVEEYLKYKM
ncbi:Detected protein of confused Function [Hibiscus syriacus]|uniref:Detected protein of confused Function n=1 Tax=Hibiscus syriacus TaxID=106335 RepID=A0A6A2X3L5_HIBSY|nr:Detected protein of confused Function [Hibiscus syriacus]